MNKPKKRQIQAIIDGKKLQQNQLAEATGLTPAYVSLVCLGKAEPKVGDAIILAQAIGEPVENLFSDFVSN